MKLLLLPGLLCLSVCCHAQLHLAVNAGVQTASASYKREGEKISTNHVTGFYAGLLGKVYFDNKAAFVTGLQYNARGFAAKTLPGDTLRTYHLNYLDIPVMVHFDLAKTRGNGLYCRVGPTLGIGIHGNESYTGANGMKIDRKAIMSVTGNYFGLFDASLNAALGYTIANKFFAEAAYAYGIGNIDNDPNGPNIKSRVLSLGIGWWLK